MLVLLSFLYLVIALYKKGAGKAGKHLDIEGEFNVAAISNLVIQLHKYTSRRNFRPNPKRLAILVAVQYILKPSRHFLCVLDSVPKESTLYRLQIATADFDRFKTTLESYEKSKDIACKTIIGLMESTKQRKKKNSNTAAGEEGDLNDIMEAI